MSSIGYTLPGVYGYRTHGWYAAPRLFVQDTQDSGNADTRELNQIDAMAASDDCFVTLATRLDTLAQGMVQNSTEYIELDNMVDMLLYLQNHYTVVARYKQSH